MVNFSFYPDKGILISIYYNSILLEDVNKLNDYWEEIINETDKQIVSISVFQFAKVKDRDVNKQFAIDMEKNYKRIEKVIVIGLNPFMKILYRLYISLVGKLVPHELGNSLEELCLEYDIPVPRKYLELNGSL